MPVHAGWLFQVVGDDNAHRLTTHEFKHWTGKTDRVGLDRAVTFLLNKAERVATTRKCVRTKVTLTTPPDPSRTSAFLNIRVADIRAIYEDDCTFLEIAYTRSETLDRTLGPSEGIASLSCAATLRISVLVAVSSVTSASTCALVCAAERNPTSKALGAR